MSGNINVFTLFLLTLVLSSRCAATGDTVSKKITPKIHNTVKQSAMVHFTRHHLPAGRQQLLVVIGEHLILEIA